MRRLKSKRDNSKNKIRRDKGINISKTRAQYPSTHSISKLCKELDIAYPSDNWWHADSKLEVILGTILTQNTSWRNVQYSIENIKSKNAMNIETILKLKKSDILRMIKPSGFYKQKTNTIIALLNAIKTTYKNIEEMEDNNKENLRTFLLSIKGIGNETADSILLYALNKNAFVIDAYTKRIISRIYNTNSKISYTELQSLIIASIPEDINIYKKLHGQFVELAKDSCKKKPICERCAMAKICEYATTSNR